MKLFNKILASSLALCLVQLSIEPAAAALRGMAEPVNIEVKLAVPRAMAQLPNAAINVIPSAGLNAELPSLAVVPTAQTEAEAMGAAQIMGASKAPMAEATLTQMGAQAATLIGPGDLAPFFTGEKKSAGTISGGDMVVPEGAPTASGLHLATPLWPRASETPAVRQTARYNQRGAANVKLIAIIGGIAAAVAITFGIIWHNSTSKNELWQNSKSNQDIVAVEKARRDGDAETLFGIAKDTRERQARMAERIASAQSQGVKKLDDKSKDDLKTGQAYSAFDGLAGMRAEENANAVSKDASRRVGGELPSTWKEQLSSLEAQAKQNGSEGALALKLQVLRNELSKEDQKVGQFQKDIKDFDDHVPGLFGGRLKDMEKKAESDLQEFQSTEVGPEHGFNDQFTAAMRGRVSDKLAANSKDFQDHRAHMQALADAQETLKPALELANQVDKDLQEMASHEHARQFNLLLASQNENVEVDDYDSNGKVIGSHYEDHSGTYKALAASEGAEARASAASAQAGIKALHTILPLLQKDKTLQAEGLLFALPKDPHTNVSQNGSVFFDFWLPASWNFFGTLFTESQAGQARASFASVLGGLQNVDGELNSRRSGEAGWTDRAIDNDLNSQMAQARQTP